jgi:hypothetical protein
MNTYAMTFKTKYHTKKSVEPIKSYEQFSNRMFSWECKGYGTPTHFTKEFLGNRMGQKF